MYVLYFKAVYLGQDSHVMWSSSVISLPHWYVIARIRLIYEKFAGTVLHEIPPFMFGTSSKAAAWHMPMPY